MPTVTQVNDLKINKLTKAQYDAAVQAGTIGANEISFITDLDEAIQYKVMPEAKAGNEGQIIQYTGEPNECTVGSYVNQYGVAPTLMPTFVYNAETFATFLSDRGANPNTGTDILFTSVPNDETGGMDLKITYNNGQDEYVVNLEEEFPNWSSYPPSKAEEYDEMYGALGFETNYTELCSAVEIMNTLEWMGNPNGDSCISLTLPNPSNYVNGYFYKNTTTSVKIINGSLSVLYFDGGDDQEDLPAPEPITFNVDTFNAYAASVSQPEVDHIDFYVDFETSSETGDRENILIHYNSFDDTISIPLSEDSIPVIQSALASVGVGIDFTGFTRFNSLDATLPIENVCSWQQVDVQPGGGSSYTAGTGIDITSGVISIDSSVLSYQNTGNVSMTILGTPQTAGSINIGQGSQATGYNTVVVGKGSRGGNLSTVIGDMSQGTGHNSHAIGYGAIATGDHSISIGSGTASATQAIQIGRGGTNADANTFKVANANGNFEMMSSDGTIPEARLADTTNAQQGDVLTLDANGDAVWQAGGSGGGLPSQTGNAGKFLTTDGTDASWSNQLDGNLDINSDTGLRVKRTDNGSVFQTYLTTGLNKAETELRVGIGSSSNPWNTQARFILEYDRTSSSARTATFYAAGNSVDIKNLGASDRKWTSIYVTKINNGADITVPNKAGTMVVADSTSATAGQVLTLDSNLQPVWQASSGGVPTLTWYTISTAGNTLTIADTSSAQLVKIYKNGLLLQPTEDYTISGTTLTTVSAMVVGDKITTEVF